MLILHYLFKVDLFNCFGLYINTLTAQWHLLFFWFEDDGRFDFFLVVNIASWYFRGVLFPSASVALKFAIVFNENRSGLRFTTYYRPQPSARSVLGANYFYVGGALRSFVHGLRRVFVKCRFKHRINCWNRGHFAASKMTTLSSTLKWVVKRTLGSTGYLRV
jgi:hypothetical protein